jgi:tetratricopeptide (TPR) repeat protein
MSVSPNWEIWTAEQLRSSLGQLLSTLEDGFGDLPVEYSQKNRAAITALRANPPTNAEIMSTSRWRPLSATLARALRALARARLSAGRLEEATANIHDAHEVARSGRGLYLPPTPLMSELFTEALRMHAELVEAGDESDDLSTRLVDDLKSLVLKAWGSIRNGFALELNGMALIELERRRKSLESDASLHDPFVRSNVEGLLDLPVPWRLQGVKRVWAAEGDRVASLAMQVLRARPERALEVSVLLGRDVLTGLTQALDLDDPSGVVRVLSPMRQELQDNLRKRLAASPTYAVPFSTLVIEGAPDTQFIAARDLARTGDPRALPAFEGLLYRFQRHPVVKEWYAYCLLRFGRPQDAREAITHLRQSTQLPGFRLTRGWTTFWNLACALHPLQGEQDAAISAMLEILALDLYPARALDAALSWALEQTRSTGATRDLVPRHMAFEAVLLDGINELGDVRTGGVHHEHFRRLSRLVSDPDYKFPDPYEQLRPQELRQVGWLFQQGGFERIGIEWFRQRLFRTENRSVSENWEMLTTLADVLERYEDSWRYRKSWLYETSKAVMAMSDRKLSLEGVLRWADRHGFGENAVIVLNDRAEEAGLTADDRRGWTDRLTAARATATEPRRGAETTNAATPSRPTNPARHEDLAKNESDVDARILEMQGLFQNLSTPESLAARASDAEAFLQLVERKEPKSFPSLLSAIQAILNDARVVASGLSGERRLEALQRMEGNRAAIAAEQDSVPTYLRFLTYSCMHVPVTLRARISERRKLAITPSSDLKVGIGLSVGDALRTHVFARLRNISPQPLSDINVAFSSTSTGVRLVTEQPSGSFLAPDQVCIASAELVVERLQGDVQVRVAVSYDAEQTRGAESADCQLSFDPPHEAIPPGRYVVTGPVTRDRPEVFHGRDKALKELSEAYVSSRLTKLHFVSGIRGVGKSSILEFVPTRLGDDFLPIVLSFQRALLDAAMTPSQLVSQLCIRAATYTQPFLIEPAPAPPTEPFDQPSWLVFEHYVRELLRCSGRSRLFLAFDEMQELVRRIADKTDPMDDGFLKWLRAQAEENGDLFIACTGSESRRQMTQRIPGHDAWKNIRPYPISMVDIDAMRQIASLPVSGYGVRYLPEAHERIWSLSGGHPWVVEILADEIVDILNAEARRLVTPQDVDRAAQSEALEPALELWWNQREGRLSEKHLSLASIIIDRQTAPLGGLGLADLIPVAEAAGLRPVGRYLDEMKELDVVVEIPDPRPRVRLPAVLLERHVSRLLAATATSSADREAPARLGPRVALLVDWENVKLSLRDFLQSLRPSARIAAGVSHSTASMESEQLAMRILEFALSLGATRERFAVAHWIGTMTQDRPLLEKLGFTAANSPFKVREANDFVIQDKIHQVQETMPDVDTFVLGLGDYGYRLKVDSLKRHGKRVILLSTRKSLGTGYKALIDGPDRVEFVALEDLLLPTESPPPSS